MNRTVKKGNILYAKTVLKSQFRWQWKMFVGFKGNYRTSIGHCPHLWNPPLQPIHHSKQSYCMSLVTPNVCYTFPNISYFSYFVKIMFGNVWNTDVKCLQMFINVYERLLLQGIKILIVWRVKQYPTSKRLYYPTSKRLYHQIPTYINIYKHL